MIIGSGLRKIIDTGFAFQQAKVLLARLEFDLFTLLDKEGMTGDQIKLNLNIHPRGLWDFLDCLLCMGFWNVPVQVRLPYIVIRLKQINI